jgi:secreted PhoX family phosphatase
MSQIERRTFLKGAATTAGIAILGGPFQGFVARAAGAVAGSDALVRLQPIPDLRDGQVRLHLPRGFQYRSFHDTEFPVTLDDGTLLPGRHDGMGAFPASDGNIWLVRNHEINNPGAHPRSQLLEPHLMIRTA